MDIQSGYSFSQHLQTVFNIEHSKKKVQVAQVPIIEYTSLIKVSIFSVGVWLLTLLTFLEHFLEHFLREATKKKVKKFHNKCELSPKMENPPSPNWLTSPPPP